MRRLKHSIWPYIIELNLASIDVYEIHKWCVAHIGDRFDHWHSHQCLQMQVYAFKQTADVLLFKLKWGNYEYNPNVV